MRVACGLLLAAAAWSVLSSSGYAAPPGGAGIPAQPMPQALEEFAAQTGIQVIYLSDAAESSQSGGAPAGLPPHEMLARLLAGSGLEFEFLNDRTVRIFVSSTRPVRAGPAGAATVRPINFKFPVAPLEEVVVTATRREEPLWDVPVSAAVWTQEAMTASGVKGIAEIAALTPGVRFDFNSILGDLFTNLVIRGVTSMNANTTAVLLDDTLIPTPGFSSLRAFPLTFDLDHVEVLRGPQNGLLGQETLGGAVRFVASGPSLTSYSGKLRGEVGATQGGSPSYEIGAAFGGPIVPGELGFRVSAWDRSDGGFVDRINPDTGTVVERDINQSTSRIARGALTWQPTSSVAITPSVTYQSIGFDDPSGFFVSLSDPSSDSWRSGSWIQQPFDDTFYLDSIRVTAAFGAFDLLSVTSYFDQTTNLVHDFTSPDSTEPIKASARKSQGVFSQELRLASNGAPSPFSWRVGFLYSDAHHRDASWIDSLPGEFVSRTDTHIDQLAVFGQAAVELRQGLTASAGLRIARSSYSSTLRHSQGWSAEDSDTSAAPTFGLSYQSPAGSLFYVTVSEGHRAGGAYPPPWGCGGPVPYAADTLWSYEVGAKATLLERRLDLDSSVFYIHWSNPQDGAMEGCIANAYRPASTSVSRGFNLAARAYFTTSLRAGLAVEYTDAYYSSTIRWGDTVVIQKGDKLGEPPSVPSPWEITASLEKTFVAGPGKLITLRAEDMYESRNPGPFQTDNPGSPYYSPDRRPDPPINILNLRATLALRDLEVGLFLYNALNTQPVVMRTNCCGLDPFFMAATLRPRTLSASATWSY